MSDLSPQPRRHGLEGSPVWVSLRKGGGGVGHEKRQRPTRPSLRPTSKAKTKAFIPRHDKANDKRPKQDEVTKTKTDQRTKTRQGSNFVLCQDKND